MRLGKGIIAERLMGTLTNDLRRGMKLPVRELGYDDFDLVLRRLAVFLGVNGLEHHRHFGQAVVGHHAEHIAIKVDRTPLPKRFRIRFRQRFNQPQALVRYRQADSRKPPALVVSRIFRTFIKG